MSPLDEYEQRLQAARDRIAASASQPTPREGDRPPPLTGAGGIRVDGSIVSASRALRGDVGGSSTTAAIVLTVDGRPAVGDIAVSGLRFIT